LYRISYCPSPVELVVHPLTNNNNNNNNNNEYSIEALVVLLVKEEIMEELFCQQTGPEP
jgi:mannitol/fructose-specific phosphotransferase system IIA component (Ntr-type)